MVYSTHGQPLNPNPRKKETCATVDPTNNHFTDSAYAYDAAGNMTKDGSGTGWQYSFDAENRLSYLTGPADGPYCYIYDGLGLRVAKISGANSTCTTGTFKKLYWRSLSGDAITETDGAGSVTTNYTEYVFFAGRRIASRVTGSNSSNTAIFYFFADQLGSTRSITTGSGTGQTPGQLCYDADFTPYGQEISYTARLQTIACPPSYKFTGYERDSETGLDYAFARYYSSRLGRFLSVDPLGGSVGNLQSHNAYAYVLNNPTDLVDPLGLDPKKKKKQHPTGAACMNPQAGCTPRPACWSDNLGCPGSDCSIGLDGAPAPCNMVFGLLLSGSAEIVGGNWWAGTGFETERGWVRAPSTLLDLALGDDSSGLPAKKSNPCIQRRSLPLNIRLLLGLMSFASKATDLTYFAGVQGSLAVTKGTGFTLSGSAILATDPQGNQAFIYSPGLSATVGTPWFRWWTCCRVSYVPECNRIRRRKLRLGNERRPRPQCRIWKELKFFRRSYLCKYRVSSRKERGLEPQHWFQRTPYHADMQGVNGRWKFFSMR